MSHFIDEACAARFSSMSMQWTERKARKARKAWLALCRQDNQADILYAPIPDLSAALGILSKR